LKEPDTGNPYVRFGEESGGAGYSSPWLTLSIFMPLIKNLIYFLEYLLFRFMALVVNAVPLSFMYSLGEFVGRIVFDMIPKRRKIAVDNIREALGACKSEKEIEVIARQSLINILHVATELVRSPQFLKRPNDYMHLKGWDHIQEALKVVRKPFAVDVSSGVEKSPGRRVILPLYLE